MKTLAIFHPSSELYGADRIMVIAVKALSNYKPVIYLPSKGALVDLISKELPEAEVKIIPFMPLLARKLFRPSGVVEVTRKITQFRRFMKRENATYNFDRAYVNTLATVMILPLLKKLKIPSFTHVHEILENPKIVAKITAHMAFKYSKEVISVSGAVQSNLHRLCKNRKAKSLLVHNGISPLNSNETPKNDVLNFYLFGRIKPEKGQWYLIKALELMDKDLLSKTQFHLVGDVLKGHEHLKDDLVQKINAAGLNDALTLHGFKSNIQADLNRADVCLVPSLMKDPFPTTVLEAMSAGKVVIATDTGGAKEAIDHNQSGFVIPANQPEKFAHTIENIIKNKHTISTIGKNAKNTFNQKFTIDLFNQRWTKALQPAI